MKSLKYGITPLVKGAFVVLISGATLLLLTATTSFLPVQAVTIAFAMLFGGAGVLSFFWKPRQIPQDIEVQQYTCAKCNKLLTRSEVYLIDGKNIIPNRRCKPCYTEDTKPKEETDLLAEKIVEEVSKQAPPTVEPGKVEETTEESHDKIETTDETEEPKEGN